MSEAGAYDGIATLNCEKVEDGSNRNWKPKWAFKTQFLGSMGTPCILILDFHEMPILTQPYP